MNSLLAALSGQFSKSLLLSTLLPVVVFVLLALVLVVPDIPNTVPILHWMRELDSEWKLATIILAVVLLTAILHNFNGAILRLYEGYPWWNSWIGQWRTRVNRRKMVSANLQWKGLWTLLLDGEAEQHAEYGKVAGYWNDLALTLNNLYPDESDAVLPTRLGNVIRSFESYPWRQYKMRAITLWPRLATLPDPSYAALIDDAKASLDFMLNASLLCGVLTVLVAAVHLAYPAGLATATVLVPLAVEIVLLGGLAYVFYLAAIPKANAWGVMVKGAFDLFRWKFLESLGYRYKPESLEEERVLWETISNRIIFSDLAIDPLPAYKQPKAPVTGVRAEPEGVKLVLLRGASRTAVDSLQVTIRVRNIDPTTATGVVVTDTVPEAWVFEWGSAASSAGVVEVTGTNPYRFQIAELATGTEAVLTYRVVPAAPLASSTQGDNP
jgi:uncharacterized repeat protein (TIGR01451 family)